MLFDRSACTALTGGSVLVGGRWLPSAGERTAVVSASNAVEIVGEVADVTAPEIDACVDAALKASREWKAWPMPARAEALRRWAYQLRENREQLAVLMTREMGKPLRESRGEVDRAYNELQHTATEGTQACGTVLPSLVEGRSVAVHAEPVGVVLGITPWNFPLMSVIRKAAPALLFGNSVIIKPASECPFTAKLACDLALQAGVLPGAISLLTGSGRTVGSVLAMDSRINAISFTGSTEVGRQLYTTVAKRFAKVQLELGGKNALYVHSVRDAGAVVKEITRGALEVSGQRCTSISRLVVEESLADGLVESLAEMWDGLTVGPGDVESSDVGPMVSQEHADLVRSYIRSGVDDGAALACGTESGQGGSFVQPTILDHVGTDMSVAGEEIFGPVLSVIRVDGLEEAMRVVNGTEYGLAASVFTTDRDIAAEFAAEAEVGMVHVNHATASQPHVPFGGRKASGVGPFSIGYTNREFFTQTKTIYWEG
ncbi:aldehyde dehydrogenase [Phytoactinopolyspora alkaliphila]|uniref:Aldehyde dehydrogenase n=1 Tax=Phytoactinopolyspora alkaliphila TaxID=1783498 RepID=A0A6N9YNI4_9ACTN|nr:aldehyde dehydrogenase family protein [Phytoactinopolyspora alkaliphila]NED96505.1 aldehyde dehydrogenase [Phytoactinopolyspora alkaliphila]